MRTGPPPPSLHATPTRTRCHHHHRATAPRGPNTFELVVSLTSLVVHRRLTSRLFLPNEGISLVWWTIRETINTGQYRDLLRVAYFDRCTTNPSVLKLNWTCANLARLIDRFCRSIGLPSGITGLNVCCWELDWRLGKSWKNNKIEICMLDDIRLYNKERKFVNWLKKIVDLLIPCEWLVMFDNLSFKVYWSINYLLL